MSSLFFMVKIPVGNAIRAFLHLESKELGWFSVIETPETPFPKKRRSSSAEASRAAEVKRLRGMSVEQRIKEALSLDRRFRGFILPRKDRAGGTGI